MKIHDAVQFIRSESKISCGFRQPEKYSWYISVKTFRAKWDEQIKIWKLNFFIMITENVFSSPISNISDGN